MAKQPKLTAKVKAFLAANATRGVVEATIAGPYPKITLKGGHVYTFLSGEYRAIVAAGGVNWHGVPREAAPCAAE